MKPMSWAKTIVVSLGGSVIVPGKIDLQLLLECKALIERHASTRFVVVCGGGRVARDYQAAARHLGATSSDDLDWVGIMATRLNAELMRALFGTSAHPSVIINPNKPVSSAKRIIIAAGYQPGHSTDMDAVLLAKNLGADLVVNLSNIDGVYDKDPSTSKNAKRLEKMSWKALRTLIGNEWRPGLNVPFDPVAAREAEKNNMKVIVANGKDISNLDKILSGKKFVGTVVG